MSVQNSIQLLENIKTGLEESKLGKIKKDLDDIAKDFDFEDVSEKGSVLRYRFKREQLAEKFVQAFKKPSGPDKKIAAQVKAVMQAKPDDKGFYIVNISAK